MLLGKCTSCLFTFIFSHKKNTLNRFSDFIISNRILHFNYNIEDDHNSPKKISVFWERIFILLVLLLFNSQLLHSQQTENQYISLNKDYVVSYFADAGDIAIAPLRWKKNQWIGFAAFTGVTLLAYSQDEVIRDYFRRNQTETKDKITKNFLDPLGTVYLAGVVGGMYIYGLVAKNDETETAALLTGKAVILTGGYTLLVKSLFQRERPNASNPPDPRSWGGPFDGFHHNSFVSGHTSVTFAAATVLGAYYKDRKWVGIMAFSLASLVAVSRVYDDKHWVSDVVAGAALGYSIGRLVYNKHEKKSLSIKPYGSIYGKGVTLNWSL